jgi:hypothetical protein
MVNGPDQSNMTGIPKGNHISYWLNAKETISCIIYFTKNYVLVTYTSNSTDWWIIAPTEMQNRAFHITQYTMNSRLCRMDEIWSGRLHESVSYMTKILSETMHKIAITCLCNSYMDVLWQPSGVMDLRFQVPILKCKHKFN